MLGFRLAPRHSPGARLRVLVAALCCTGWTPVSGHERAVDLLVALSTSGSAPREVGGDVVEDFTAPGLGKAWLYRPKAVRRAVVLAHGVHAGGIDEPRLVRFATELASLSIAVVTPSLPSLSDYRITVDSVELIARAVHAVSGRPDLSSGGKVGLIGISFGGGLSLVAAGRDDTRDRLDYVASIGGHHDLHRVLLYLLTNRLETPGGVKSLQAHEYGPAVLAYGYLDELVKEPDRVPLRAAFRAWLTDDRAAARKIAENLASADARGLFSHLMAGTLNTLSSRLMPLVEARTAELDALSPRGKLARISAPVYLLHGTEDRLIPSAEVAWAARELEVARVPHRVLVTPLIEHVTVDRPANLFERLALVDFIAGML